MSLLTDGEIYTFTSQTNAGVSGVDTGKDFRKAESQIRAAALDLRVGQIFLPGADAGDDGSIDKPKTAHSLRSGETAIVTPIERFDLPPEVAGVCFPSSQVSIHGLLMTNPGYIDPGYIGSLRFTVINMGERPYDLRQGDRIVTLMLFRLPNRCAASWRERKPGKQYLAPTAEDLGSLARDFLNVEKRAEAAADKKVRVAGLSPVVIGGIITVALAFASYLVPKLTGIDDLKARMDRLEERVAVTKQLNEHEQRIETLENPRRSSGAEPRTKKQ